MTTTQTVLTVLIVACLIYVAVSTWREHRPRHTPGRHRATRGDLAAFHASDLIAGQDAAARSAQQRMAAAVARETGR